MNYRIRKAVPATFAGSTRTGANGRKNPAKWNVEDKKGKPLARIYRGPSGWTSFPFVRGEIDFGTQLCYPQESRGEALEATIQKLDLLNSQA